ncbi:MAG: hypothetical protein PHP31_07850 [Lentimicrobiaceae bacterium]|nr:hypothetical protein [Lentimicrobiaceae bacterium]
MVGCKKIGKLTILLLVVLAYTSCKIQYQSDITLFEDYNDSIYLNMPDTGYLTLSDFTLSEKETIKYSVDSRKDTSLLTKKTISETDYLKQHKTEFKYPSVGLETSENNFYHNYSNYTSDIPYTTPIKVSTNDDLTLLQDSIAKILREIKQIHSVLDFQQSQIKSLSNSIKVFDTTRQSNYKISDYNRDIPTGYTVTTPTVYAKTDTVYRYLQDNRNTYQQNELAKAEAEIKQLKAQLATIGNRQTKTITKTDTLIIVKEVLTPTKTDTSTNDSVQRALIDELNSKTETIVLFTDSIIHLRQQINELNEKSEYDVIVQTADNDTVLLVANYEINKKRPLNETQILDSFKQLNIDNIKTVLISGYTDVSGNRSINRRITEKRLAAMRLLLNDIGIDKKKIFIQNFADIYASKSIVEAERRLEILVIY